MSIHTLPGEAIILDRIQEAGDLFTLRLKLSDPELQQQYRFEPGQFNMLYLHGVGEVPISIVSDPTDEHIIDHTIRAVGRVTHGLADLKTGDTIGLRGPFGHGWPMQSAENRDVVIITGGLGCAPVVSAINYIVQRRERFGHLNIVQGVKHSNDFIWRERYDQWRGLPDTRVLLAADQGDPIWPWHVGLVTELFNQMQYDTNNVIVMMCGPEGMMHASVKLLLEAGIDKHDLWLSLERSMKCAIGHCGHCQLGGQFVCRDGPVFCYPQIENLFKVKGF
jgi:sulfhydrogenase subunit gamma (sulfur reductase)